MSGSTLFFEPGGLAINEIEIDGAALVGDGQQGNVLMPVFFLASVIFNPLLYGGGLSDLFCAKPVPDTGSVFPCMETFTVPPGKISC
jgi:hypothetical protein